MGYFVDSHINNGSDTGSMALAENQWIMSIPTNKNISVHQAKILNYFWNFKYHKAQTVDYVSLGKPFNSPRSNLL